MNFRKMTKDDIRNVVEIIKEHDEDDRDASLRYYESYFSDRSRIESDREENYVAVDPDTDRVIGVCGFCPDKYGTKGILWLNWFYLRKEYRGKGNGARLLNYTLDILADLKVNKVYLDTSSYQSYARAVQLYRDFGFIIEGELIDYYGEGENNIIMGLDMKYHSRGRG